MSYIYTSLQVKIQTKHKKNKNKFTDRQSPDTNTPESDWKYKIIRIDKQINKINKQINKERKLLTKFWFTDQTLSNV